MAAQLGHCSHLARPTPTFLPSITNSQPNGGSAMDESYSYYGAYIDESVQHDQTNLRTAGLDGTDDRSLDDPFKRSKRTSRNMSTLKPKNHTQVTIRSPTLSNKDKVSKPASDVTADCSPNRRKRRKIDSTQNDQTHGDGTVLAAGDLNQGHGVMVTNSTLDNAADLYNRTNTGATIGEAEDDTHRDEPVLRTPQKDVKARTHIDEEHARPMSSADSSKPGTATKQKRSTPRKKTISLHTNGKLLSSPAVIANAQQPKIAETTHLAKNQTVATARNIKMKNGRFVQSLEVVLRYGQDYDTRNNVGTKIANILSTPADASTSTKKSSEVDSKTHPFFLGKTRPLSLVDQSVSTVGDTSDNDSEKKAKRQEPVAWKDIKFTARKSAVVPKGLESPRPVWPPLPLQHVGREALKLNNFDIESQNPRKAKLKSRVEHPTEDVNLLQDFVQGLQSEVAFAQTIVLPERLRLSGDQVRQALARSSHMEQPHDAILDIASRLGSGSTAFDQGRCAGPNMWPIQYAPSRASEVLQTSTSILYQWLQGLAVHNVKSGLGTHGVGKKSKGLIKKKRRKVKEEFDGFIVNSEDDQDESSNKNAILLVGPYGCGKTASVFAVAKELGFEIFEIHPGMRRSAKDIFDKVGDMAHNHLVQKGTNQSRASSVALSDIEVNMNSDIDHTQPSVAGLMGKKLNSKLKAVEGSATNSTKREQKQSLILFEEVDHLFDDDKGFWSGVQSLIQNSKRPVVMTCNDISSIPIEELNLYDILRYTEVDNDLATDLLMHIAAAEGHIVNKEALSTLYRSKGNDLRASITELNLWCQMTVGSKQGGLDWMARGGTDKSDISTQSNLLRTFSKGTYHKALDLVPQLSQDNEIAVQFAQDSLGIAATEWCDFAQQHIKSSVDRFESNIDTLSMMSSVAEARSVVDTMDQSAAPILASTAMNLCGDTEAIVWRDVCSAAFIRQVPAETIYRRGLYDTLAPLHMEKPTFPPSQGRLAPSIDLITSSTALDIAPYVRCIVGSDIRLEQQRNEVFGSQGKTRNTRAARAAAEGGDKASTRSSRWFPAGLDFQKVLDTAGPWPVWVGEDQSMVEELGAVSPSAPSPKN